MISEHRPFDSYAIWPQMSSPSSGLTTHLTLYQPLLMIANYSCPCQQLANGEAATVLSVSEGSCLLLFYLRGYVGDVDGFMA